MNRRVFKSQVVDIVLDAMKAYCNVSRHIETTLVSKNNGFYFKFHRHGEELQLIVYPDGSLGIKVRHFNYDDQLSSYYVFCEDDDHEALLPVVRKDLTLLIQDFYGGMRCQTLAEAHINFTLSREATDWMEAYEQLRKAS